MSTTAESRTAGARDGAAVQTLEMAMAEATDPVILRNLRAVAEHIDAEVAGVLGQPFLHVDLDVRRDRDAEPLLGA